jgi:hypothetical protein
VLGELQRKFGDVLRGMDPVDAQEEARAFAEDAIAGNGRLSGAEQLDIYREQYYLRHTSSLRDDYLALCHYMGEAPFYGLLRAYLLEHPPRHFSLQKLGNALPAFVHTTAPYCDDPLLCDLATLDEAFLYAIDTADSPPFDTAMLGQVAEDMWPQVKLRLHSSLRLLSQRYRLTPYRIAARERMEALRAKVTPVPDAPVPPSPQDVCLVVSRGKRALEYMEVDAPQLRLLRELQGGAPLGEACARSATESGLALGEFESKLGDWFAHWTAWGWIRAIEVP